MATTALWAIRGNVRDVVAYVKNPVKTKNPDSDLRKVLDYAEDGDKTEKQYFVTGINCSGEFAYERMMATKEHYGKTGGIVAYHGYQSFKPGELTPELCHKIGVQTAKKLWGDRFEVVVATHLVGSSALHNHFVINSVSFKDGKKFRCQKHTHLEIREVSDRLCRFYSLSVIENPAPKKVPRAVWMAEKQGKETHSSVLRKDIEKALEGQNDFEYFLMSLENMGYVITRDERYKHISVMADGWDRPLRIDRLGSAYTTESIENRLWKQRYKEEKYPQEPENHMRTWSLVKQMNAMKKYSFIDVAFMLFFEILNIPYPDPLTNQMHYPKNKEIVSPRMKQASVRAEKYTREIRLIAKYGLHEKEDVQKFIEKRAEEIASWENERKQADNRRRRMTDPAEKEQNSHIRHEITQVLIGLRREKKLAEDIWDDAYYVAKAVNAQKHTEARLAQEPSYDRNKNRNNEEMER